MIDLWTLQTDNFIKYLFEHKISWDVQKPDDLMFLHAYDWLVDQMCVQQQRMDKKYPIWAWHQYMFNQARPDMRLSCVQSHLKQAPNVIHIRVPANRVTLSSYDRWHAPLNNSFYTEDEDLDRFPDELFIGSLNLDPAIQERIYKSWNSIFDISDRLNKENFSPVQATLFELYPEDIISIKRWQKI